MSRLRRSLIQAYFVSHSGRKDYTIICERADNSNCQLQFVVKGKSNYTSIIRILNDASFTPIIISDGSEQTVDLSSTSATTPKIMFSNFEFVYPYFIIDEHNGTYTYSIKNLEVVDYQPENTLYTSQFIAENIAEDITIPSRFEDVNLQKIFEAYRHSSYDNLDYVIAPDLSNINLSLNLSKNTTPFKRIQKIKLPQNTTIHTAVASSDNSLTIDAIATLDNVVIWVNKQNLQGYDLIIPNGVTTIPKTTFELGKFASITVPSTVSDIGNCAFSNCTTNITFLQPCNMQVSLPTPGAILSENTGMFYNKTSRSGVVKTDNILIANYDYESDNFNVNILHLDNSDWKLNTPIASISNNIISWNAVQNAVAYKVGYSTSTSYTYIDTINTSLDLTSLGLDSGQTYNIVVIAIPQANSSTNIKSDTSTAVQYTT